MTRLYVQDTDRLGLDADGEPLASETLAEIISLIETLIDSDHAYEAGETSLPGPQLRRLRQAFKPRSGRDDQGEEAARAAQAGPARLRALEGAQGGRGHRLAIPWG